MTSALPTALAFARHGHPVFPVNWPVDHGGKLLCSCGGDGRGRPCGRNAAKHPYGKLAPRGLLSATTEPGIIKHRWGYSAPQANLGVVTDRLVVVDIDPRHDGDQSLAVLIREHGEMPLTWRALTGGGGEHLLFAWPGGVDIGCVVAEQCEQPPLGRGIDIRARGGYIVAPPSRHISGRQYKWSVDHHPQDVPLAPAPDWLIERLAAAAGSTSVASRGSVPASEWAKLVTGAITEYRDHAAARLAGLLFRRGLASDVVVSLLRGWNVMHCVPPLTDGELLKILERIAARELRRLRENNS